MPPAIAVATVVVAADRCRCVGFVVVVVVVGLCRRRRDRRRRDRRRRDRRRIVRRVRCPVCHPHHRRRRVHRVRRRHRRRRLRRRRLRRRRRIAVATATVSSLPILVDCCPCPRRSLLPPLMSPPTAVAVSVAAATTMVSHVARREIMRGGFEGEMRCGWMDVRYRVFLIPT